ncbi:MAG: PRC-barrel domain-containing protein [Planctomycetota bacterium]|nr:PRC-barrel domain-containing protein [Planctomycetaceae bacterium]MDQ3329806.1 PRC-barrel domain-containing protein [Planctomycetota bacterium]
MPRIRSVASIGSLAALLAIAATAQDEPRVRVEVDEPRARANDAAADRERDAGFYRASEVIGTSVKGEDGQSMGRIEDLLIDGKSQQIRYFILSDGEKVDANAQTPAARSSSNVTVVPWSVARPQFGRGPDSRFVTVPFARQRLQQAPTYTWQEIQTAPTRWAPDVDRFYNVPAGSLPVPPGGRVEVERDGDIEIKRDRD